MCATWLPRTLLRQLTHADRPLLLPHYVCRIIERFLLDD